MGEVNTILHCLHLKELGDVDCQSSQQGGEDVDDDPVAPALDLPVVVRSTDSQISLHTDTNDEEDAAADAHPVERVVEEGEEELMVEHIFIHIHILCSQNFKYCKNEVEAGDEKSILGAILKYC